MKPFNKTFFLGMMLVVGVVGCAGKKTQITSTSLPTMKELYQQKYGMLPDKTPTTPMRITRNHTSDWNAQVRDDLEPLYQEFRYLPNPLLTLYVFPHLTDAGTPVPGYTTFFKFYKTDQMGLAHEFPPIITHKKDSDV